VLGACFCAFSFLTKQTALVASTPILLYLFFVEKKRAAIVFVVASLIICSITLLLNYNSEGWYSFYTFTLLFQQTEWIPWKFFTFWNDDLIKKLHIAILFTLFFFLSSNYAPNNHNSLKLIFVLLGATGASFLTRIKVGGYDNVLIPAYSIISITFGLGLNKAIILTKRRICKSNALCIQALIYVLCLVQLISLSYDPSSLTQTRSDYEAMQKILDLAAGVKGDVFIPEHGNFMNLIGKKNFAHHSAIWDVLRAENQTIGKEILSNNLEAEIRNQRFDMIILDSSWNYCCQYLNAYYKYAGRIFSDETSIYPANRWKKSPMHIYIAKRLQ
jgi:hypothetical protein